VSTVPPVFVLLGKPDCHLCHEMEKVVAPVLRERGATLVVRDVRDDPQTERRWSREIPVLLFGDREVARHRISPEELRARLADIP
jgi:hypothetical protein